MGLADMAKGKCPGESEECGVGGDQESEHWRGVHGGRLEEVSWCGADGWYCVRGCLPRYGGSWFGLLGSVTRCERELRLIPGPGYVAPTESDAMVPRSRLCLGIDARHVRGYEIVVKKARFEERQRPSSNPEGAARRLPDKVVGAIQKHSLGLRARLAVDPLCPPPFCASD